MSEKSAKEIIIEALDEFDVEDFIDPSFNEVAASKIIAALDWNNFKLAKLRRVERTPFKIEETP